jgi:hypothetical protein
MAPAAGTLGEPSRTQFDRPTSGATRPLLSGALLGTGPGLQPAIQSSPDRSHVYSRFHNPFARDGNLYFSWNIIRNASPIGDLKSSQARPRSFPY